jgi:drug/metabolite transporter (DMT)-like permease
MQLPAMAAWAWIPIVIWAAFSQTIRNAAQRTLTSQLGTLPATLVRFLYGLPCAVALLWLVLHFLPPGAAQPHFGPPYVAWMAVGAISQLLATALLLLAMKERNFIVAVAYSKTEVLQVALFAALFLNEFPGWFSVVAMLAATAGVVMLSAPKAVVPGGEAMSPWLSRTALFGIGSGACFALAGVGYRGASLTLPGVSPWLIGAWNVVLAQALQTVLLGGYLAVRQPGSLLAILRAWRLSSVAGTMGALASMGWLTAYAMRPAADVRTLGLVEVIFSYLVSRRLFKEKLSQPEVMGLMLVTAGLVVVCSQL